MTGLHLFGRLAVFASCGGLIGCATSQSRSAAARPPVSPAFWSAAASADVIYVGERHAEAADHDYEFEIIKGLKVRGVPFAIGWEMFEVNQQPLLDVWQSGGISLAELLRQTDWAKHWGKYSPTYERMLRWSRAEGIENYALNAPASLSRKIARGEALTPEEQHLLPLGFKSLPGGLQHFKSQMGSHPDSGPIDYNRYYRAQTLWDQTMADRIVVFRKRDATKKLVVFAGRGHVEAGYGIPPYVKQKLPSTPQKILLPGETPSGAAPATGP